MKARKIAVVGLRSVGKLLMTVRFVEEHFVELYYPTIENQFLKTLTHRGQDYAVDILDTAGQDEYSIMNEKHLIGIHGYLVVYLVTLQLLFELVDVVRDKILQLLGAQTVPMVLVGNKCDLAFQRQVLTAQGEALARRYGCLFLETLVRDNVNIAAAFEALVGEIERIHNPQPAPTGRCAVV